MYVIDPCVTERVAPRFAAIDGNSSTTQPFPPLFDADNGFLSRTVWRSHTWPLHSRDRLGTTGWPGLVGSNRLRIEREKRKTWLLCTPRKGYMMTRFRITWCYGTCGGDRLKMIKGERFERDIIGGFTVHFFRWIIFVLICLISQNIYINILHKKISTEFYHCRR